MRKRRELCKTISEEYTKGTKGLLKSAHHLIYGYYRKTLFAAKQGQQRDWINSIQQAREDFQNEFAWQPVVPQHRNLLLDWLSSKANDTSIGLPTRIQIASAIPIVSSRRYSVG